jgi:hypothetical protein
MRINDHGRSPAVWPCASGVTTEIRREDAYGFTYTKKEFAV